MNFHRALPEYFELIELVDVLKQLVLSLLVEEARVLISK